MGMGQFGNEPGSWEVPGAALIHLQLIPIFRAFHDPLFYPL